jgi:hypothetical protein
MYAPHLEHPHPTDSFCLALGAALEEEDNDISLLRELVSGKPLLP